MSVMDNENSSNSSWEVVDSFWRSHGQLPQLPTDERLASLDHNILRKLAVQLNELQVYRNQRVPLLLLPEEILLEIMFILRDVAPIIIDTERGWTRVPLSPSLAWLSIIQTCHHLRAIALRSKALWSHLSDLTMLPSHVALGLAHSGKTPLHLHLAGYLVDEPRIRSLLAPRTARRVRSLVLELSESDVDDWNTDEVEQMDDLVLKRLRRFKQLASLTLVAHRDDAIGLVRGPKPEQVPPKLDTLHLNGAAFLWKNAIYNDLRTLRLIRLGEENSPRIQELSALFRRISRIETLDFDRTDVCEDDTGITETLPETWPHSMREALQPPSTLKHWSATMPVSNNVPFAMLPPAPTQDLRFTLHSHAPPQEAEFIYDNFLSRHLASPALRPRAIAITLRDGPVSMDATIRFWRCTDTSKPANVELHRAVDDSAYVDPRRLVNGADLSYVETLVLDVASGVCFNWWLFFTSLQKLRTLRLAVDLLGELLYTIGKRRIFAPASMEGTCSIAAPVDGALQEVEVFVSDAEPKYPSHRASLKDLIQWMKERLGTGLSVQLPPTMGAWRVYEAALFEWSRLDVHERLFRKYVADYGGQLRTWMPRGRFLTYRP
ncbi:unnamed protein product [Peniophora sp. CBMAI 1063]|nr:unnamed protein product [Peniophora sp. CBMAI 1063]